MCVVRVPGGAVDAGNAWSDAATASVWIPKKVKSYFIGLFLLPIYCVLLYDNIDIICAETLFSRNSIVACSIGSRGLSPGGARGRASKKKR